MDGRKKQALLDQITAVLAQLEKAQSTLPTPPVIIAVEKLALVVSDVIDELGPSTHAASVRDLMPRREVTQGDGDRVDDIAAKPDPRD